MRLLVGVVLLSACAPGPFARVERKPLFRIDAPRVVTLVGEDGEQVAALEAALVRHGFSITSQDPGAKAALRSKIFVKVSGQCRILTGCGDLRVDTYDSTTSNLVFAARLIDATDCPKTFFEEVASDLAREWGVVKSSAPEVVTY